MNTKKLLNQNATRLCALTVLAMSSITASATISVTKIGGAEVLDNSIKGVITDITDTGNEVNVRIRPEGAFFDFTTITFSGDDLLYTKLPGFKVNAELQLRKLAHSDNGGYTLAACENIGGSMNSVCSTVRMIPSLPSTSVYASTYLGLGSRIDVSVSSSSSSVHVSTNTSVTINGRRVR